MDERRHHEDDDGEGQQHVLEDVEDLVEVVLVLSRDDLVGHDLEAVGDGRGQDGLHGGGVDSLGDVDADVVVALTGVEHLERRGRIERHELCPDRLVLVGIAEVHVPNQLELLGSDGKLDGVPLADDESLVAGGVDVHGELVGADGLAGHAVVDGEQLGQRLLLGPVHPDLGRTEGVERLAVGLLGDDVELDDAGVDGLDAVDRGELVDQRGIDGCRVLALAELLLGADVEIDAAGDVVGQLAEGAAQAVGDDEGAHDEGDPQHDGQGGEEEADLLVRDRLEGELGQGHGGGLSRRGP